MFYYLEGNVTVIEQGAAVLDIGGAGYFCRVTISTLSRLEAGKRARLYTYCSIREDAFDIYGFWDQREKRCFELLLSVSGVGPKAALSILSSVTPENLAMAIVTENEKVLTTAPGVGKRIAQRIILELKDKMASDPSFKEANPVSLQYSGGGISGVLADAQEALLVLGFSNAEAAGAIRRIDTENMTAEEIIRAVLRDSVK